MFSSVKLYNVNARSDKICWVEPFLQRRKLVEGEFNCDQVFFFEKIAKKRMPEICFPSHQPLSALKTFIWLTCHLGTKDAFYQIPNVQLLLPVSGFFACETCRLLNLYE